MHRFFLLLILASLVGLVGCSTRVGDFTVASTKNIDWSRASEFIRHRERVDGKDERHIVVIIPTGNPSVKEAVDDALHKTPGSVALVDVVIKHDWFYIPYIFGRFRYTVEGHPLIDPNLVPSLSTPNLAPSLVPNN